MTPFRTFLQGTQLIAADGSSYGFVPASGVSVGVSVYKFKADGTPDTSYGTNGIATIPGPGSDNISVITGEALQPDGKILVCASYLKAGTQDAIAIFRFNTDGTPDVTLGQNGVATFVKRAQYFGYPLRDITVLSGGQILVSVVGPSEILLAEFGSDGSPELTFGSGGVLAAKFGVMPEVGTVLFPMPDGTFLLAGNIGSYVNNDLQMALGRFNADGSVDTAFGSQGLALAPFDNSLYSQDTGRPILASNGDIVQIGLDDLGNGLTGTVIYYRNDGSLDPAFGSGGEVFFTSAPEAVAFQPNGQLVIAGVDSAGLNNNLVVTRLNADGSLDAGFGQNGSVTTPAYQGGTEGPERDRVPARRPDTRRGNGQRHSWNLRLPPVRAGSIRRPDLPFHPDHHVGQSRRHRLRRCPGATQLDATAIVSGTFTYSPRSEPCSMPPITKRSRSPSRPLTRPIIKPQRRP